MKLEALNGGVIQSAFNNFAKFTVEHLCGSLFLIKLQAWWCATFSRKKNWYTCFPGVNGCLSEMNQNNCIYKIYLLGSTGDGVLFRAVADMWAYSFSKNRLHHIRFSMKIDTFYGTSIYRPMLRLLLICCDIFNALLALLVIDQFSHSIEI